VAGRGLSKIAEGVQEIEGLKEAKASGASAIKEFFQMTMADSTPYGAV
jgi:hypothetical protein